MATAHDTGENSSPAPPTIPNPDQPRPQPERHPNRNPNSSATPQRLDPESAELTNRNGVPQRHRDPPGNHEEKYVVSPPLKIVHQSRD